jgi:Glycosyl hydrolases family 25
MLYGIDISHHQSGRDRFPLTEQNLEREKLSFLVIKATQGYCEPGTWRRPWNFRDPWFLRHLRMARDVGVPVIGAYHYLLAETSHTADGQRQAEFFVRAIERVAAGGDGLLLGVDFEGSDWVASLGAPADFSPRWPDLRGFIKRFRALLPEHPLLVYTSPGYAGRLGAHDLPALDARSVAWNAEWPDMRPAKPDTQTYAGHLGDVDQAWLRSQGGWTPGWGGYARTTILQFTDRARFEARSADADAFDGSLQELRSLASGQSGPSVSAADRPAYRRGYNAVIDAVLTASAAVGVPGGGAVYEEGVGAARADIASRLPDWRLRAPEDP